MAGNRQMTTEEKVISVLKEIVDPHTNINVYDMGLIRDLVISGKKVSLTFRPTSPFCPLGVHLALNVKRRLKALEGVTQADVRIAGHIHEDAINRTLAES